MQGIKCCTNCVAPRRKVGCHATCAEYLSERKALDEFNAAKHEQEQNAQGGFKDYSDTLSRLRKSSYRKRINHGKYNDSTK